MPKIDRVWMCSLCKVRSCQLEPGTAPRPAYCAMASTAPEVASLYTSHSYFSRLAYLKKEEE